VTQRNDYGETGERREGEGRSVHLTAMPGSDQNYAAAVPFDCVHIIMDQAQGGSRENRIEKIPP